MTTPAGWYPDPNDSTRTRWWDGTQWTENYSPAAPAAPAAPNYPAAPQYPSSGYQTYPAAPPVSTAPSAPGADTNTLWIYLAILASTLPVLSIFFLDWNDYLGAMITLDQGGSIDDAAASAYIVQWVGAILLITLLSYLLLGVSVLFSWLDWRELKKRGVAKPFHWGFAFFALIISIGVYIIGRTVVLKRETGSGLTALWVWIGSIVLSFVIVITWTAVMWQRTLEIIPMR